jgi:hypothetical protein
MIPALDFANHGHARQLALIRRFHILNWTLTLAASNLGCTLTPSLRSTRKIMRCHDGAARRRAGRSEVMAHVLEMRILATSMTLDGRAAGVGMPGDVAGSAGQVTAVANMIEIFVHTLLPIEFGLATLLEP